MSLTPLKSMLFLAFTLLSANSQAKKQDNCLSSPFTVKVGQLESKGFGKSHEQSIKNAHVNLQSQISAITVEDQFIQRRNGNSINVQSNSQIRLNGSRTKGVKDQETFRCTEQYVTYVLYDNRSLAMQISAILGKGSYKLVGQSYLITSPLLAKFNQDNTFNTIQVSLFNSNNNDFLLTLGNKKIVVSKQELPYLVQPISIKKSEVTQPLLLASYEKLEQNKWLTIDVSPVNASSSTRLYYCSEQAECSTLHSHIKHRQQLTLLTLSTEQNVDHSGYVFLVSNKLLEKASLAYANASTHQDFYFQLLDLVHKYPEQTNMLAVNNTRNF